MALKINFKKFLLSEGIRWKKETAGLLRQGRGPDGGSLAPKKWKNGRRLGYDKSNEGIPGRVQRAPVTTRGQSVVTITVGKKLQDMVFHYGRGSSGGSQPKHGARVSGGKDQFGRFKGKNRSKQPARPYAYVSDAFVDEMAENLVNFIELEAKFGLRKGRKK